MLFDKYQITEKSRVQDSSGTIYFAKWLGGIKHNSEASKILFDKLRHLKKVKHEVLIPIVEYGWDEEEKSYCIIFQHRNFCTLKEKEIKICSFLLGIKSIIKGLKKIHTACGINHRAITPSNILVDDEGNFCLANFYLGSFIEISDEESKKDFAAPEKYDKNISKSFPYQKDIYSLGKIIDWFFKEPKEDYPAIKELIDCACQKEPSKRINYHQFLEKLSKIINETDFNEERIIYIDEGKYQLYGDFLEEVNDTKEKPRFNISPKEGDNILLGLATKSFCCESCLWQVQEEKIVLLKPIKHLQENKDQWGRIKKYGQELALPITFTGHYASNFDLTPYFKKIQKQKIQEKDYRQKTKSISEELSFFKKLLDKEIEEIEKNALQLRYKSFQRKGRYSLFLEIEPDEKYSKENTVHKHIDRANPPHPEEFSYLLSPTADKSKIQKERNKKGKKAILEFSGVVYNYGQDRNYNGNVKENKHKNEGGEAPNKILKIKDCDRLKFDNIPPSGYLFEDVEKTLVEKKRQQEAIKKVEFREAQNNELIHKIFNPKELEGTYLENIYQLDKIYQQDEKGNNFKYSPNQTKAINNALLRTPLTVIQGPPGTGKTTVITEIVYQILHKSPDSKILITSQTNSAVDNVLENLLQKDIPFVRLSGVRLPDKQLQKHTLDRKIEGWKRETTQKAKKNWQAYLKKYQGDLEKENVLPLQIFKKLIEPKEWQGKKQSFHNLLSRFVNFEKFIPFLKDEETFKQALQKEYPVLKDFFEKDQIHKNWLATVNALDEKGAVNKKLIDTIQVFGSTANHIASGKYKDFAFSFDYVIMDESGKATTAESLVPIVLAEKLILVGDHRQLRPMLTANHSVEKWLREKYKEEAKELESWDDYFNRPSLFENIIEKIDKDFKSQLEQCRRSSKEQVKRTSQCFYEPFGDSPIAPVDRPAEKEHNLNLKINSSILFYDIGESIKSKKDGSGSSFNQKSAALIPRIIEKLDTYPKVKNYSIGVITGYTAQLRKIRQEIRKQSHRKRLKNIDIHNSEKFIVSVVDRFQGLEKDIIIFDLVRAGQKNLGFLANPNRINVALSRQKRLLIIVGAYDSLINAQPPNSMKDGVKEIALQKYLKSLKQAWIVNTMEQIF